MTMPGLALFYGGMVRRKNILGTIMQSIVVLCLVSLIWILVGYSLAFGPDQGGLIGSLEWAGLNGVGSCAASHLRPHDSPPSLHVIPAHACRHHAGTDYWGGGGAHEVFRAAAVCGLVVLVYLMFLWPIGSGAVDGWGRWARSTLRAARWCISRPA